MAKYSTGGSSGGGEGDTCELCGASSDSLRTATVAGARLEVCPSCAPHDDAAEDDGGDEGGEDDANRAKRAAQNAAKATDVWTSHSEHWEKEGTDYEEDQLPYLVPDYGKIVVEARQEAGLQREELADELGVDESDVLAVEQGRATRAGIGGSLIAALEDYLDVTLSERT